MSPSASPAKVRREETGEETAEARTWRTVLHNCECHTFDEVEVQLQKAIRCTLSKARALSWEVHSKGRAVVYEGEKERCEAVASVLAEIGLIVEVLR